MKSNNRYLLFVVDCNFLFFPSRIEIYRIKQRNTRRVRITQGTENRKGQNNPTSNARLPVKSTISQRSLKIAAWKQDGREEKKCLKNIFLFLFTSTTCYGCECALILAVNDKFGGWVCEGGLGLRYNLCSNPFSHKKEKRHCPLLYLAFPCLKSAKISSNVLFFVSGTFL